MADKPNEIEVKGHKHHLYDHVFYSESEMSKRALDFYKEMNQRRSLREFSNREVAKSIITTIIQTASTSPSGAH